MKLTKEEFTQQFNLLNCKDRPLVIFGAGEIGMRAILRMDYLGWKENIACMGDNNKEKAGTTLEEIPILSMKEIKEKYPNARIVIAVGNTKAAREIENQLKTMGFKEFISRQALLHRYEFDGVREKALAQHNDTFILRQIVVTVTEKCTLKCKNCIQFMPKFKEPKHADKDIVIESVKRLTEMVTYIQDVSILGGEPLMYPYLVQICEEVGKLKLKGKVKFISILSNATLIPREELLKVMKKYNITMILSDYGILSAKMQEIQVLCTKAGVEWRYAYSKGKNEEKIQQWFEIGALEKQNLTLEAKKLKFANCNNVYDCNMIYKGRYYLCSTAAFLTGLGILDISEDSFDLLRNDIPFDKLTHNYLQFMKNEKVIEACNYCNMHGEVPVAEQL
ncbi:MAG: radical SAM protein [Lachnospiraceae bacterium]